MSAKTKRLAVNVDIDAIHHYANIHGIETSGVSRDPVWHLGVPRFRSFFADLGIKATFFVVASDLVVESEGGTAPTQEEALFRQELIQSLIQGGHEIASHSFGHDYALSKQSGPVILEDLNRARAVLEEITGRPVIGFRAPGYNLSSAMIDAIQQSGATYSSSRFPSPPYFLAKWAVMTKSALTGRRSGSIVGELGAPFRSKKPYRHKNGLLELPMSVIPGLRLPAIGTFFTFYGKKGPSMFLPMLKKSDWLNLEFHGIDLIDSRDQGVPGRLAKYQSDLKRSAHDKEAIFKRWIEGVAGDRSNRSLACFSTELHGQSSR